MLIVALLAGILLLASSPYGISISVSNNAGGFTENINAKDGDSVFGRTIIGSDSLSNSIEGSGSFSDKHSVSNKVGATAEVGVDIYQAEWYSYSYDLWPASKSSPVAASEQLDILNARYITAYANAFNSKGYATGVSTVVLDSGNEASLMGYRNLAMASKNEAFASQTADSAFSPNGYIQLDSGAEFEQLKSKPLQFREDTAEASTRVVRGSIEGYSDLASASAQGIKTTQQMDSATGSQIRTKSASSSPTAWPFQGMKKTANAKVSTTAEGTLTGYNVSAESSQDYAEAEQAGHIFGTFSSTAVAGKANITRTSNYGNEYDFSMHAKKDASGSFATGTLGYYVDNVSPSANRIQGAVDASESGDAINIAPGTYFENVQIDKSLYVNGAGGAYDTIVDGQQSGSVFTIGMNNPNVDVALSGMTIQGGSGTYTERWPGEPLVQCGGGIWNAGRLSLMDSIVWGNTANEYGSGIWSTGNLTVDRSLIYGNEVPRDGGGIWNSGELTVRDSTVAGNSAYWNGGGIWSSGNMLVENSYIAENTAGLFGGGIANDMGQATMKNSTISENTAAGGGGGVYNIFGIVSLEDSNISWNSGNDGGGIYSFYHSMVNLNDNSRISYNKAARGGGIFNNYYGIVNLNSGSIDHNNATSPTPSGGGIYDLGILTGNIGIVHNNTPDQIVPDVYWIPLI